jgi:hypothetical protein
MSSAMGGDFSSSNKGIVLGIIFGGLGLVAQVVSVRRKEGSAVTALEYACFGAGTLSFLISCYLAKKKWSNPGDIVTPTAHRVEAVFDIFTTTTQVVMGVVIFGFVASNVANAVTAYNKHRILPETFSWISSLLDQAGSVTTSAACFVSVDPAKTILIGCSAIGKTTAAAFKVLEVVALKTVTEKFQTATA